MVLFSIWALTSIYWRSCGPLLHMGSNVCWRSCGPLLHMGSNVYLLEILCSSRGRLSKSNHLSVPLREVKIRGRSFLLP